MSFLLVISKVKLLKWLVSLFAVRKGTVQFGNNLAGSIMKRTILTFLPDVEFPLFLSSNTLITEILSIVLQIWTLKLTLAKWKILTWFFFRILQTQKLSLNFNWKANFNFLNFNSDQQEKINAWFYESFDNNFDLPSRLLEAKSSRAQACRLLLKLLVYLCSPHFLPRDHKKLRNSQPWSFPRVVPGI